MGGTARIVGLHSDWNGSPGRAFEQSGVRIQVELWVDDYRLSAGLQGLCTTPGGAIDLEHIMNGAPELYHAQP